MAERTTDLQVGDTFRWLGLNGEVGDDRTLTVIGSTVTGSVTVEVAFDDPTMAALNGFATVPLSEAIVMVEQHIWDPCDG